MKTKNNRQENLEIVKGFFDLNKIKPNLLEAFLEFLDRMPLGLLKKIQDGISCVDMANTTSKTYKVQDNPKSDVLICFGDISDLQHSSSVGLIAHLFALIYIRYHENPIPIGEEWLKIDLYSDQVAKGWGFKSEIEDLRKIRPQKIPAEMKYADIVIKSSVPNKKFGADICSVLNKNNEFLSNKTSIVNKIWYVDRFSMICGLRSLRENSTDSLYIFTNKYIEKELEEIFSDKNCN